MKKLNELTKKQKILIGIALLAIIIIILTFTLSKSNIFEDKSKSNNLNNPEIKIEDRCDVTAQVLENIL